MMIRLYSQISHKAQMFRACSDLFISTLKTSNLFDFLIPLLEFLTLMPQTTYIGVLYKAELRTLNLLAISRDHSMLK